MSDAGPFLPRRANAPARRSGTDAVSGTTLLPELKTDAGLDDAGGLSSAAVAERISVGATNAMPRVSSRSVWDIVRANVFTLFNGIVAGSFALLLLLGQWRDALFKGAP